MVLEISEPSRYLRSNTLFNFLVRNKKKILNLVFTSYYKSNNLHIFSKLLQEYQGLKIIYSLIENLP